MKIYDRLLAVLLAALLAACGSYVDGQPAGDGTEQEDTAGPDASPDEPDAGEPALGQADAAGQGTTGPVVLSHSASAELVDTQTALCQNSQTNYHAENSYYRAFTLDDFDVLGALEVQSVSLGIDEAIGAGGSQPITIRLHTLNGPLLVASLAQLAEQEVLVPDTTLDTVVVPVRATVPVGAILVVEVLLPDGRTAGNRFLPGVNAAGQTGQTYLRAPDCGIDDISDLALYGPTAHLVMSVAGTAL